jgi:hypothetical protein
VEHQPLAQPRIPRRWRLTLDEICAQYSSGNSLESIAEACGLKYVAPVVKILQEIGLEPDKFHCPRCDTIKHVSEFYSYHGILDRSSCKSCRISMTSTYRNENLELVRSKAAIYRAENKELTSYRNRVWHLKKNYGLTLEQYDEMLASQDGKCFLCGTTDTSPKNNFAVDHDHACCPGSKTCGKCIRGLLCFNCNFVVGYIERKFVFGELAMYLGIEDV